MIIIICHTTVHLNEKYLTDHDNKTNLLYDLEKNPVDTRQGGFSRYARFCNYKPINLYNMAVNCHRFALNEHWI